MKSTDGRLPNRLAQAGEVAHPCVVAVIAYDRLSDLDAVRFVLAFHGIVLAELDDDPWPPDLFAVLSVQPVVEHMLAALIGAQIGAEDARTL